MSRGGPSLVSVLTLAALTAAVSAGCGFAVKRPDGGEGLLPVGADAPEVVSVGPGSEVVKLSSLKGHAVVVYFYPADGTPGCTKEACAFRDAWSRYAKADVGIIGVSSNSAESHSKFQKEEHLPFPLAADDGSIAKSYGVKKNLWGYERVSFLVGKDGKVARVWPDVDPGVHADDVLRAAESL